MLVSTDRSLLDIDAIHAFLSTCYWSPGIARGRVERAIEHSLCVAAYDTSAVRPGSSGLPLLVGFARVVTDHATFAYLCDVFVVESYRGRGISKRLMDAVVAHPSLRGIRRLCLLTRDAHGLYAHYGLGPLADPSRYMERVDPVGYRSES